MSLDKYHLNPSPFQEFYSLFLKNAVLRKRYLITLKNGGSAWGIPVAAPIVDNLDPNVSFSFYNDAGVLHRIPFKDLVAAKIEVK